MGEDEILDNFIISSGGLRKDKSGDPQRLLETSAPLADQIDTLEKQILEKALVQFRTTRELARQLGISQPTVVRKLRKYDLSRRVIH